MDYMKIATYNLHNLYDTGTSVDDRSTDVVSESFFNKRITFFTEQFRALNLDIICLQEVGGEKGISMIGDALGYGYFFARPNKRGIRMAVLYKKELAQYITCESVSLGDLYIPSIQERGDTKDLQPIAQRRDILEITLKMNDTTISINTFHLKSNLPQYLDGDDMEHDSDAYVDAKFRCVFYKTMELRAIRKHTTMRLQEGKEVILLGDFNENNTASIMDILKGNQQEELRLEDVLKSYVGDAVTHYHRGGKLTFDTILVSAGLQEKVTSVHIENKELTDCSMLPLEAEVVGTDHALVWMEMR
jgi:exonuclease III